MSEGTDRARKTGKRALRFVATTAVVVAPISFVACGGAKQAPESGNVVHAEEHTNISRTTDVEEAVPEGSNVDHSAEPHTNVGPEEEAEEEAEGGGDKAAPQ